MKARQVLTGMVVLASTSIVGIGDKPAHAMVSHTKVCHTYNYSGKWIHYPASDLPGYWIIQDNGQYRHFPRVHVAAYDYYTGPHTTKVCQ